MFWWASKRLGRGYRIGIGSRVGGTSRRPTVYELRQQEKDSFIKDTEGRIENLIKTYFFSLGYVLLPKDVMNQNIDIANPIMPHIKEFYNVHRLVKDGGNLTDKRKETMLEQIYAIEDIVNKLENVHPILALYNDVDKSLSDAARVGCVSIIFGLIGIYYRPLLYAALIVGVIAYYYNKNKVSKLKKEINEKAVNVISEL